MQSIAVSCSPPTILTCIGKQAHRRRYPAPGCLSCWPGLLLPALFFVGWHQEWMFALICQLECIYWLFWWHLAFGPWCNADPQKNSIPRLVRAPADCCTAQAKCFSAVMFVYILHGQLSKNQTLFCGRAKKIKHIYWFPEIQTKFINRTPATVLQGYVSKTRW